MSRSIIKNLSMLLVMMQLASSNCIAESQSTDSNSQNTPSLIGETINIGDEEIQIYKRLDSETGEYKPVSIFDKVNNKFDQYGASQQVFRDNSDKLIQDSYIWDELQKYFPVEQFDEYEDAIFFYKKYLDIIYDCGCGYAAAANFVFHMYEGKEEEFFNTFGYPMYTNKNGIIDFNYEVFMLKFFNYSNIDVQKLRKTIEKSIARSFYDYKRKSLSKSKIRYSRREIALWTEEQWNEFREIEKERKIKLDEYNELFNNSEDFYYNFGIEEDSSFGYLYMYLRNYGVNISSSFKYGLGIPQVDNIVSSDDYILYTINNDGSMAFGKNVDEAHYIYISEITEDGLIIVSSWGEMYYFDNTSPSKTKKIILRKN